MSVKIDTGLRRYISIARPDHWVKHVFIFPGIMIAIALAPTLPWDNVVVNIIIGFVSAGFVASANYVINEWLDAETDRHHPEKSSRPAAMGLLEARYVYLEYALLSILGLGLAVAVNPLFFAASLALFVSGITYNVKPFRTKDRTYFDVFSEAINSPIRLILGWAMVSSQSVPPLSLVASYWAGGAFLMAAKRLSEYRFIAQEKGEAAAGRYRRSFNYYSVESLLLSCFVYALMSTFGIAVFLIKYREEFIIMFPLIVLLFMYYLYLGLQPMSVAQKPEKLYRDWRLLLIVGILCFVAVLATFVDMPVIAQITQSKFVDINFGQ